MPMVLKNSATLKIFFLWKYREISHRVEGEERRVVKLDGLANE